MPELTEFQKKRLENIKRNNDLLKKLHLSGVASQIKHEAGVLEKSRAPAKKNKKQLIPEQPSLRVPLYLHEDQEG
ncbi:CFC_collapsed_G0007310.mRNA.1.CDS.1 [Saccharomyces cerevisiae]|nr:ATV_collapsed_G0007120.mRNA.1.CDS.1 [Saccharomyces cerevisiae]CAI7180166.1 CFC_collapsed_G0007310.mRNA.1.CDS.1 [Saccharomyces cerevisiae]